jgi:hypothetical protein
MGVAIALILRHDAACRLPERYRHLTALLSRPARLAGLAFHISRAGAFGELTIDTFCKSRAPGRQKPAGTNPPAPAGTAKAAASSITAAKMELLLGVPERNSMAA